MHVNTTAPPGEDVETPEPDSDPSPPESRASPSFSFHEERRLLKSDEFWLSHKLPRLPPASVATSPTMEASMASVAGLAACARTLELDDEEGEEAALGQRPLAPLRPSTMLSPSLPEYGGLDPALVLLHRQERDQDEQLDLEEEKRERMLDQMSSLPLASGDKITQQTADTGESPRHLPRHEA
jgi:AMP deaminase